VIPFFLSFPFHFPLRKYPVNWWVQFTVLLARAWFQAKGVYLSLLNWFNLIVVALASGLIWFQIENTESRLNDRLGALFFTATFAGGFFPLFNAITTCSIFFIFSPLSLLFLIFSLSSTRACSNFTGKGIIHV